MERYLRFWGVRGSISSPGTSTVGVGGNTSCIEVQLGGEMIIIDGGTGLRELGASLAGRPLRATILFTHLHWDHIQGLPFFAPFYHPGSDFTLIGPEGLREALENQMSRPTFPVGMEVFNARMTFVTIKAGDHFEIGDVNVETAPLDHPGGSIGYRLSHGGRAVTTVCDHEQGVAPHAPELLELLRGADVMIMDSQYLPEEYPSHAGWGHSTYEQGAALASAAGVKRLFLTHHEPTRTDREVADLEERAQWFFPSARAAREGMLVKLDRPSRAADEPICDEMTV